MSLCFFLKQYVFPVESKLGLDLIESVFITTNVMSSNPVHVLNTNYVTKLVSDSKQIGGFLRVFRFPPPRKLTANTITTTTVPLYIWVWVLWNEWFVLLDYIIDYYCLTFKKYCITLRIKKKRKALGTWIVLFFSYSFK
jgi:hypothetical protein